MLRNIFRYFRSLPMLAQALLAFVGFSVISSFILLAAAFAVASGAVGDLPKEAVMNRVHASSILHQAERGIRRASSNGSASQNSASQNTPAAPESSGDDTQSNESTCPPDEQALEGVYHPERLKILNPCQKASGTVAKVSHEKDGDLHIRLTLDPQYSSLLSEGNNSKQHGDLVVEYMARDGGHLTEPKTGDHLDVLGVWVDDEDHNWNEIHPVFSASLNGGLEEVSGPRFGGSPASDRARNAASGCHTETGQACSGYGTGTDTSDEPSDSKAEGAASQASPGNEAATGGDQTNSGGYYTSSYKTATTIYCANDPTWQTLSPKYLVHFDTLEEAQQAYPGKHLHRPC